MTALMWAAKHGHQEVAKLLLKLGKPWKALEKRFFEGFEHCFLRLEQANALRNAGENPARKDDRGWVAADHAHSHAAMVTLLEAFWRLFRVFYQLARPLRA